MSFSDEYDDYNRSRMNDLIEACDKGDWSAVNLLLSSGADVSIRNENGYTPFLIAVANGHLDIVREFLFRVPKVAGDTLLGGGATTLDVAANYGCKEVAELLLECPEIGTNDIDDALRTAMLAKNYNIVNLLSKYTQLEEDGEYNDYD